MKKTLFVLLMLALNLNAEAEQKQYLVQSGDNLAQILRTHNYGQSYSELLPFIQQVMELNPQLNEKKANFIIPGTEITLPENPNEPKPEPVPEPLPELVLEPEPIPEPEPEPAEPVEQPIGSIDVSKGISDVIRDKETITITEQQPIYLNDVIMTRDKTQAEISLQDDTTMTLGPNSHFVVNEFSFSPTPSADGTTEESLVATIHKGVMRVITGLIGKNKENKFDIKSAFTATIGIRGTDFTVRSCTDKKDCGDLFGVSAAVMQGGINLKNEASEVILNKNEFAQIKSAIEAPEKLPLPEGFFDLDQDVSQIEVRSSWWQKAIDWVISIF